MTVQGREAHVVFDLGLGDAGKGRLVDALVRRTGADLVVRAHGGAQAGHNVVTHDGRHHTFSSFASGGFAGARTHLGADFVCHPLAMRIEARVAAGKGLGDLFASTTIDRRARLTSPFQQVSGRLRELARGTARHGTCGVGFGETVADDVATPGDTLRAADLQEPLRLRRLLARHQERARAEWAHALDHPEAALLSDPSAVARIAAAWAEVPLQTVDPDTAARRIAACPVVVFEGAQGVLLDETWGLHPHTTWSDCTPRSAAPSIPPDHRVIRWAVTRTYATRHGAGPFPHADPTWTFPEPHNGDGGWQGEFRRGPLDRVLLTYALRVAGGADRLAVTHIDRPVPEWVVAWDDGTTGVEPGLREDLGARADLGRRWAAARGRRAPFPGPEALAASLDVPLGFVSTGPAAGMERWG